MKIKLWYGVNSGVMLLLSLLRLSAWLDVTKKFSSRKTSKSLHRKINVCCLIIQIIVTLCGIVVIAMDYSSEYCRDNSTTFMSTMKLSMIYIVAMLLVNFVYSLLTVKETYSPLKRRYLANKAQPNIVYESSDDVDDRTIRE